MEKDVETKLREKFALIDKNDVEQLAEAQKVKLFYFFYKLKFILNLIFILLRPV